MGQTAPGGTAPMVARLGGGEDAGTPRVRFAPDVEVYMRTASSAWDSTGSSCPPTDPSSSSAGPPRAQLPPTPGLLAPGAAFRRPAGFAGAAANRLEPLPEERKAPEEAPQYKEVPSERLGIAAGGSGSSGSPASRGSSSPPSARDNGSPTSWGMSLWAAVEAAVAPAPAPALPPTVKDLSRGPRGPPEPREPGAVVEIFSSSLGRWCAGMIAAVNGDNTVTVHFVDGKGGLLTKALSLADPRLADFGGHVRELPPDFRQVPSQSRPGQFSYLDTRTGMKLGSVALAWRHVIERMIDPSVDPRTYALAPHAPGVRAPPVGGTSAKVAAVDAGTGGVAEVVAAWWYGGAASGVGSRSGSESSPGARSAVGGGSSEPSPVAKADGAGLRWTNSSPDSGASTASMASGAADPQLLCAAMPSSFGRCTRRRSACA
mmetsp:Transcript_121506/g.349199  ORF Transcript_121506/g.349199 Transcript_121506/m.349199 type:complete len:431 (-) Transcript_121506:29-1321(-)|eukprot:CAMPEP_0170238660 /NCGR_PEP_ID=MMETSP0116_2-20130129/19086_1 /TAXON_ID=400756 /ORGANISM="Durinskia baltica, Strain CSIRO CS-38" /LENGTH=430 /DNA_ID=CAMNT_0010489475 /DNA_START=79 /DNA_END=1371 /DNA_ORIENTATION=+